MASESPNRLVELCHKSVGKIANVMLQLKKLGEDDPRRIVHSLKVGLAITLVSTFYYFDPLYHGLGSSATWAVFTVIVVSEFSVGATLGKGLNRGFATILAGTLGIGCFFLAESTGEVVEPILLGISIFLLAAGVTYIRFFPQVKKRYDYGLLVFILTFCLLSVSSYRDDHHILEMAKQRAITILIGGLISVVVCIFVFPVWAGDDLHNLVSNSIEKLGNFLEGFGDEYFQTPEGGESDDRSLKSELEEYKSVLNSKQTEENLANFVAWEPFHGKFKFRYPWHQYPKIGSLSRQCAYRIDALNGYLINSTREGAVEMRSKIQEPCMKMSKETGKALKALSVAIKTMVAPSGAEAHINKSKMAAKKLRSMLKTGSWEGTNLLDAVPEITVASLLIEVVSCTEQLAESVQQLSSLAKFKRKEERKAAPHLQHPSAQQSSDCDNSRPPLVITVE